MLIEAGTTNAPVGVQFFMLDTTGGDVVLVLDDATLMEGYPIRVFWCPAGAGNGAADIQTSQSQLINGRSHYTPKRAEGLHWWDLIAKNGEWWISPSGLSNADQAKLDAIPD